MYIYIYIERERERERYMQAVQMRRSFGVRPISLLTLSLRRLLDSNFPGNPLWTWEYHPLRLRLCSSQNHWIHNASTEIGRICKRARTMSCFVFMLSICRYMSLASYLFILLFAPNAGPPVLREAMLFYVWTTAFWCFWTLQSLLTCFEVMLNKQLLVAALYP